MTEFERINAKRPGAIIKILDTIETSANSNKATPEEVAALLQPVADRLSLHTGPSLASITPVSAPPPRDFDISRDTLRGQLEKLTGPQLLDTITVATILLEGKIND